MEVTSAEWLTTATASGQWLCSARGCFIKALTHQRILFQNISLGNQDARALSLPSIFSVGAIQTFLPGQKVAPPPLMADNRVPEWCMENELERAIWWQQLLMFPRKTSGLRSADRSICIYSRQLHGNLRGKRCTHEYRSSITMPHLKFRFLHCSRTCEARGLLTRRTRPRHT